jgi:hypothetical protein
MREEVREEEEEKAKIHKEELHNLCSSPDIIRAIKSRRMSWAGHVARVGKKRKSQNEKDIYLGKPGRRW